VIPGRVIAVDGGFVAIGNRAVGQGQKPPRFDGLIWTSIDGIDWSEPEVIQDAELHDIDSAGELLVIAGAQALNAGTSMGFKTLYSRKVWTSRADGPWQAALVEGRGNPHSEPSVAVSPDGVYLLTGFMDGSVRLSTDGQRFEPLPAPDGGRGWGGGVMAAGPDGFTLVDGGGQEATIWTSPDGRDWRRGDTLSESVYWWDWDSLAHSGVVPSQVEPEDGVPGPLRLDLLRTDGSWCAVSAPVAGVEDDDQEPSVQLSAMASSVDGRLVLVGWQERPGVPIIWQATGVRCAPA
jgi:hypothetical protein